MGRNKGPRPKRRNVPVGECVKFGDLVRGRRISLGYTQEYLAKIIGISRQSMVHIEQGVFPNGKALIKLMCVLHLEPDELLALMIEADYAGSET